MAKKAAATPANTGTENSDTDVMEGEKFDPKAWSGETTPHAEGEEGDDESKGDAGRENEENQGEQEGEDANEESEEVPGNKDDGGGDLIGNLSEGIDNDFSLNDEPGEEDEEGGEDEGKTKSKKKISDDGNLTPVARIAKEFELGDVQDTEQLISAVHKKLDAAKAGNLGPVVAIDKALNLPSRDLYLTYLMKQRNLSEEAANKHIDDHIRVGGEDWLEVQADDLRLNLRELREGMINDHTSREAEERKKSAQFYNSVRTHAQEMKTMLGVPLKPFVGKLKEYNAQLSTNAEIDKMRNDPKLLTEALFAHLHGKTIMNDFLKSQGKEKFEKGWAASFKQNVHDKILNKGKGTGQVIESGSKGSENGATFNIDDWNKD